MSTPPPASIMSHMRSSVGVGSTFAYRQSHHCEARISRGTCMQCNQTHSDELKGYLHAMQSDERKGYLELDKVRVQIWQRLGHERGEGGRVDPQPTQLARVVVGDDCAAQGHE